MKKGWLIVIMFFLAIGTATAAPIYSSSFEGSGDIGGFQTIGTGGFVDGWQVVNGSVDWVQNHWQASDGARSLDLSGNSQGTIAKFFFGTVVNQTYKVSFDMAGNPDGSPTIKTLQAAVAPTVAPPLGIHTFTFDTTGKTRTDMGWETKEFYFTAVNSWTALAFGDLSLGVNGEKWYGAALDNVRIAPVPEPGTLLLLGSGLAGVAWFARRRKNQ